MESFVSQCWMLESLQFVNHHLKRSEVHESMIIDGTDFTRYERTRKSMQSRICCVTIGINCKIEWGWWGRGGAENHLSSPTRTLALLVGGIGNKLYAKTTLCWSPSLSIVPAGCSGQLLYVESVQGAPHATPQLNWRWALENYRLWVRKNRPIHSSL